MNTRRVAVAVASVLAIAVAADVADAGRRRRRIVKIGQIIAPLGKQGLAGAGPSVVMGFTLWDDLRRRDADVEVQFVRDYDSDGALEEDEWRPATENRLDLRGTRSQFEPFLFASGTEYAVPNAFVWDALADLGRGVQHGTLEYALDVHGRRIPDPNHPGSYLFATLPNGRPVAFGLRVRMRTLTPRRGHRRLARSDWATSDSFGVDNTLAPSMTIDSVESGAPIVVRWTAYDADSEDGNGNGLLDLADGEDKNGNGVLDRSRVGVAFDFHIVTEDEDPASMTDSQLAQLGWMPCTRFPGAGDTDSLDARPGVPVPATGDVAGVAAAPKPVGRSWLFVWDPLPDIGPTFRGFIVRATPFDETRAIGETVYSRTIVHRPY